MRKRNIRIRFWLDEIESEKLNNNVVKAGLSRENYIRSLINGRIPKPLPPLDYYKLINEMQSLIGKLERGGLCKEQIDEFSNIIIEIKKAMELPVRIK